MPTNGLYYPWIDPPSKVMLINSLLYWDHLYTIVPESETKPFQNRWSKAAFDYGFLKPREVSPFDSAVSSASSHFARDLERNAIACGVRHLEDRKLRKTDNQGYRISRGKFSERLLPENLSAAMRKRIWKNPKPDNKGFLLMNAEYALPYMSQLASTVADEDRMTAFTDQRWGRDVVVDRYVDNINDDRVGLNEARLATLSFNTIRMSPHVTLADVIHFRDSNQDALKRYRKSIHSLALQVSGLGSVSSQEREIERIVKEVFKPAREELGAKMKAAGCDFTLNATQTTCITGLGGLFGGVAGALISGLVGIGFSAVRWRIAKDRIQRENPMTYLVELRKQFHEESVEDE